MTVYEREYADRLSRERTRLAIEWNRARINLFILAIIAAAGWACAIATAVCK